MVQVRMFENKRDWTISSESRKGTFNDHPEREYTTSYWWWKWKGPDHFKVKGEIWSGLHRDM